MSKFFEYSRYFHEDGSRHFTRLRLGSYGIEAHYVMHPEGYAEDEERDLWAVPLSSIVLEEYKPSSGNIHYLIIRRFKCVFLPSTQARRIAGVFTGLNEQTGHPHPVGARSLKFYMLMKYGPSRRTPGYWIGRMWYKRGTSPRPTPWWEE